MNISVTVGRAHLIGNWKLETYSNILSLKPARRVALFFSRNYRFCNLTPPKTRIRKMLIYVIKHTKMFEFFGRAVRQFLASAIQRGPVGLLGKLPKEFTREQVRDLRIKQGMNPDPKAMLSNWKQRGLIVAGEVPNTYVRV